MLDYFNIDDGSLITWSHAVNNKFKLNESLKSECKFIEADIIYDKTKHVEPIMAHPPDDQSDLTFVDFIQMTKTTNKGLKLDFKTIDSIEPCLLYLNKIEHELTCPIILNADVLQGENSPKVTIDPGYFINTCTRMYPNGILSLGWTTIPCTKTTYTWTNINDAINLYNSFGLSSKQAIHFAIRLTWSIKSINKLIHLTKMTNCSYTIWSHQTDKLSTNEHVLLFREFFNSNKIFYDLPIELTSYLNENKLNYKTILYTSNDQLIKSYLNNVTYVQNDRENEDDKSERPI